MNTTIHAIRFSIPNRQWVSEELANFRQSVRTSITRSSIHRAAEPLRRAMISAAPVGSGPAVRNDGTPRPRLRDTFRKRTRRFQRGDGYYTVTGPRARSDGRRGSDAPHAHLVDRGTVRRFRQVINGKYYWVQFTREWKALGLQAQRAATPRISQIRPHISYGLPGVYQNYLNRTWKNRTAASRQESRSTEAGPEFRYAARALQQTRSQIEALFVRVFEEKVLNRAARQSGGRDAASVESDT